MTAEAGHAPNRIYADQDGAFHINGAGVFNDSEQDISAHLESLGDVDSAQLDALAITGSTTCAADALAIPITHRVVVKTTGADAEALTLADGIEGQKLTIVLGTDGGGDGTLTPTTKTGFATIVLADAKDNVTLEFVDSTVGWIIVGAAGVAAPPVIS